MGIVILRHLISNYKHLEGTFNTCSKHTLPNLLPFFILTLNVFLKIRKRLHFSIFTVFNSKNIPLYFTVIYDANSLKHYLEKLSNFSRNSTKFVESRDGNFSTISRGMLSRFSRERNSRRETKQRSLLTAHWLLH